MALFDRELSLSGCTAFRSSLENSAQAGGAVWRKHDGRCFTMTLGDVAGNSHDRTSRRQPSVGIEIRPRIAGAKLSRWFYDEIRAAILEDRLAPGAKLPSKRALAGRYRVAIGTVGKAFDQLIKQGYLEGHVGIGTYVRTPHSHALPHRGAPPVATPPQLARRVLSTRGRALAAQPFSLSRSNGPPEVIRLDWSCPPYSDG